MGGSSRSTNTTTQQAYDQRTFIDDHSTTNIDRSQYFEDNRSYEDNRNYEDNREWDIDNSITDSYNTTNEIDKSINDSYNTTNEYEIDNSIELGDEAIYAQGDVHITSADADVISVALDGATNLATAGIDAGEAIALEAIDLAEKTSAEALLFAQNSSSEAITAATAALNQAFENTTAGLAETVQGAGLGVILATGAVVAIGVYLARKQR